MLILFLSFFFSLLSVFFCVWILFLKFYHDKLATARIQGAYIWFFFSVCLEIALIQHKILIIVRFFFSFENKSLFIQF